MGPLSWGERAFLGSLWMGSWNNFRGSGNRGCPSCLGPGPGQSGCCMGALSRRA